MKKKDTKSMNSCFGCPLWDGKCKLTPGAETPEDAYCYGDEEHYLNRDNG